jgi:hypothetical protein
VNRDPCRGGPEDKAGERLAVLKELIDAVQAAHLSLAEDRLVAFCDAISRLRELCARWQSIDSTSHKTRRDRAGSDESAGSSQSPLTDAHRGLAVANYRLSSLLRRSRRSVELLANLHRASFREPGSGAAVPCNVRSWSAEV